MDRWSVIGAWTVLLIVGCVTIQQAPNNALPDESTLVCDQLIIRSDFDLPRGHRLVQQLADQRAEVSQALELPPSTEPIHVFLFDTPDRYQAFISDQYPEFPSRRAFFVENENQLTVYAHWGDRVTEDLRHEVAHGYLHSMIPGLPLWLDEGLAEYFERPPEDHGMHRPHLNWLTRARREGRWHPDMSRLERFRSPADMAQGDYAEAWGWVYYLMWSNPERKQFLRRYLARVSADGLAEPLSVATRAEFRAPLERDFVAFLEFLAVGES